MNLIFCALFFITTSCCSVSDNNFVVLTLPRSGSGFFTHSIRDTYGCGMEAITSKQDRSFRMRGEFFTVDWRNHPENIFKVWDSSVLEDWYQTFKERDLNATKECHAYTRVAWFAEKFHCVFLYRHRKYTLPSSRLTGHMYEQIYKGFLLHDYDDIVLQKIKNYCKKNVRNIYEEQCSAHIVAWYVQLKNWDRCSSKEATIIKYKNLMLFDRKKLEDYLSKNLPLHIQRIKEIAEYIVVKRNISLKERLNSYRCLRVEGFCRKLLVYMKNLDPTFKYWTVFA